ncbi:unnamed protein product [Cuscuta campestris]|uniref:Uncharacterized protein n=2 Tax=Cuscuta sect. Cleistogrammica TaxID=1824901 RepID=A0A484LEW3_9ASTE|nr:hypothetical protein DM860_011595 [Cuscuta australis]VFQ74953.1 unnamed protein product [Cuscuta campestris]
MSSHAVSSGLWTKLADIDKHRTSVAIHARAIRVYEISSFGRINESMEVIFHDDQADDPIKRRLFEENPSDKQENRLKAIKVEKKIDHLQECQMFTVDSNKVLG